MTGRELFDEIRAWGPMEDETGTCDTFKCGNPDREIHRVGVAMLGTPRVLRQAAEAGVDLLIVHEPLFYRHMDDALEGRAAEDKKRLLEELGLTVVRYHDHAHRAHPDMIWDGELTYLGLAGQRSEGPFYAVNEFLLDEPMTARALALALEARLGIRHVRIAGAMDTPGRRIGCCFGDCGHIDTELERCDFVLCGETCEWQHAELARDLGELGYGKALLVMGHECSERAGMMRLRDRLAEAYPALDVRYFESGDVYGYTH